MKVSQIMSKETKSAAPADMLESLAQTMQSQNIGLLPVTDNGKILGVVTDRDIVTRGLAQNADPRRMTAREAMSSPAACCHADDMIENAARQMKEGHFRRLPVLDRAQKLVGVVSLDDIARQGSAKLAGETLAAVMEPAEPNLALA